MTSVEQPTRSFSLALPDGFVALPADLATATPDRVHDVAKYFARLFDLPADDENAAAVAVYFTAIGTSSGEAGIDHTELAMYRSPDAPDRAMMIILSSTCVPADHVDTESAIAGLVEVHTAIGQGEVSQLTLPVGQAVVVVAEERNDIAVGDRVTPVLHRAITAWVPDPAGTTLGVVSMSSNNWQDWPHICRLALNILETMRWDDKR